jgi:hypothetical protein
MTRPNSLRRSELSTPGNGEHDEQLLLGKAKWRDRGICGRLHLVVGVKPQRPGPGQSLGCSLIDSLEWQRGPASTLFDHSLRRECPSGGESCT